MQCIKYVRRHILKQDQPNSSDTAQAVGQPPKPNSEQQSHTYMDDLRVWTGERPAPQDGYL